MNYGFPSEKRDTSQYKGENRCTAEMPHTIRKPAASLQLVLKRRKRQAVYLSGKEQKKK